MPSTLMSSWAKPGRRRWLGWRPTVRGSAMDPASHPHGGGEGKAGIGMAAPKTPWGKKALGVRTTAQQAHQSLHRTPPRQTR